MKYVIRALKYFIQISVTMSLILGILMLAGLVSSDINIAFREGWKSVAIILGMFAVVSAVYPRFGYGRRSINAKGEPSEHIPAIKEAMNERGYDLEKELPDGSLCFRLRSVAARFARVWEDRITISPELGGFSAEGLNRDLARVASHLNYTLRGND